MSRFDQHFEVLLHGERIGTIARHHDYSVFSFDDAYLEQPDRPVLGLTFEEDPQARYAASLRLHPWFSNLLPEGPLREWIAQARDVSPRREMELLAEVGEDLPGAVRIREVAGQEEGRRHEREVFVHSSVPLETGLWKFSLAGVAMKFSMLAKGGQFTAPGVGEGGDWIIKLPYETYPDVPLNEFAMMELARLSGVEVPEFRLVHRELIESIPDAIWASSEVHAYAVRRFDRAEGRTAVHFEELAQVRSFYPEDKYKGSFETVAALIYRRRDVASLLQFVRRMVFNLMIENGDAHLKNWALIYRDRRTPSLSPAYDLVATSLYRPANLPEDLGLKFCRTRRLAVISLACFGTLARTLGTDAPLEDEARAMVKRVLDAWPQVEPLLKDRKVFSPLGARLRANANRLLQ